MRIAVVHSYYSRAVPSGENSIVDLSVETLRGAGHDVEVFARHTDDDRDSPVYALKSGMRVATGLGASPSKELREFRPDVIHVHNLFPNFGTRWLSDWRNRLVATVHNFRPVCANGLLFRRDGVCMDCPTGSPLSAIKHACYRDSRTATLPLAARNFAGLGHDPVFSRSSRLIVLSEVARDLFTRFGGNAERMVVLPNGVPAGKNQAARRGNGRWLAVGRLTSEKGMLPLIQHWPASLQLDVVGEGPLAGEILAKAPPAVRLLGQLSRPELLKRMTEYEGLVFPSVCLEMQPTAVIEAMSVGLPVVALSGNAGADLVTRFGAGHTYSGPDDLEQCLFGVRLNREALASAGRRAYERHYTPKRWLEAIEDIYTSVAREAGSGGMA